MPWLNKDIFKPFPAQPATIAVSTHEGSEWQTMAEFRMGARVDNTPFREGNRVHAIMFDNGWIWDSSNGWRGVEDHFRDRTYFECALQRQRLDAELAQKGFIPKLDEGFATGGATEGAVNEPVVCDCEWCQAERAVEADEDNGGYSVIGIAEDPTEPVAPTLVLRAHELDKLVMAQRQVVTSLVNQIMPVDCDQLEDEVEHLRELQDAFNFVQGHELAAGLVPGTDYDEASAKFDALQKQPWVEAQERQKWVDVNYPKGWPWPK